MHDGTTLFESVYASRHLVPERSLGSGVVYTCSGHALLHSIYCRTDGIAMMQQSIILDYAYTSRLAKDRHRIGYNSDLVGLIMSP